MQPDIKILCRNKWHGLLPIFGIDSKYLVNKHGPCPICNGGRDRFRFDNKNGDGTFFCSKCGAGDGLTLAMNITGMDFKGVAQKLQSHVGKVSQTSAPKGITHELASQQRNALWKFARPIEAGDFVCEYLVNRGIEWVPGTDFRKIDEALYFEGRRIGSRGLIAMVRSPDGKPATLHQTPIENGKRNGKRYLSRGGYPESSAIRLQQAGEIMGAGEGIESVASGSILHGDIPVWALMNSNNLMKFVAPEICKKLIIFADCDSSFTGQMAAYHLAKRHKAKGIEVEVFFPDASRFNFDWNDYIMERRTA